MKNLLVYINPHKKFGGENEILAKIQIDNSLDLGWRKEDIILVTNFEYEYNGVKALVVGDENYCVHCPAASKIDTIAHLFERKLIENGELHWFHDLDAYQVNFIDETDVDLELGAAEVGVTDYGRMPRFSTGTIFFKDSSGDIFSWIKDITYKYKTDEERALMILTGNRTLLKSHEKINGYTPADIPGIESINERIKKVNTTYNFAWQNARSCYRIAKQPLKVVHFYPFKRVVNKGRPKDTLSFFMYGDNKVRKPLMSERLIKIFNEHNVR